MEMIRRVTFPDQVLDSCGFRDQQLITNGVCNNAVNFFRHCTVKTAESGLDMRHRDLLVEGGEARDEHGGGVTLHHEDVRRAQPSYDVRILPDEQQAGLWKAVRLASKTMTRKAPSGLVLRLPDGTTSVAKRPTELGSVTVTGEPAELVLFCFGRQQVADVRLEGDAELIERLRSASFGV